jgi:tetratricopeptide (TPR) repeat protein
VNTPATASAANLHQAARAAMARKDARAARIALAQLLDRYPEHAPGWLTASIVELGLGQPARALQAAERGLALGSPAPALLVQHVRCLHEAGRLQQARQAARTAEPALAHHPALLHELGNAWAALGDQDHAARLLARAAVELPNDPALAYNLAALLRYLGRFEEAEQQLNQAIALAPSDWEAYATRSQLRVQTPSQNHIAELESKLSLGIPGWAGAVQIHYALAKEYEDIGNYTNSFRHLTQGAGLRRAHLHYDIESDIDAINQIIATFRTCEPAPAASIANTPVPIFVFGLPRSGTTLIDRILSSHAEVMSHGELNDFPAAVITCAGGAGPPPPKGEMIRRAAAVPPAQIGANYTARVARLPTPTAYFIDKLPMNYLYAGLIAAALPHACLIHVSRHPMANGYGMYKTLFQQGYPFSYDLDELGQYIGAYTRLAAHWRAVLGHRLISIQYETLVANQESETRRLLQACGLPWHAACLSPHQNAAPSLTQSAVQVRRPVYTQAVDQWRHYEQGLAPLARSLRAAGVTTNSTS